MSISFDGANSKLENTGANLNITTQSTIVCWINAAGKGESSAGVIFAADETGFAGTGSILLAHTATTDTITFGSNRSTTDGFWDDSLASLDSNTWWGVAIAYDSSLTANNATGRKCADGPSSTPTDLSLARTAPVGTQQAWSAGYCIGNRSDQARTWNGLIAYMQIFNTLLSTANMDLALKNPGCITSGLVLYLQMYDANDILDRSGNGLDGTGTSLTTSTSNPNLGNSIDWFKSRRKKFRYWQNRVC